MRVQGGSNISSCSSSHDSTAELQSSHVFSHHVRLTEDSDDVRMSADEGPSCRSYYDFEDNDRGDGSDSEHGDNGKFRDYRLDETADWYVH
jgi:hypothetical protein